MRYDCRRYSFERKLKRLLSLGNPLSSTPKTGCKRNILRGNYLDTGNIRSFELRYMIYPKFPTNLPSAEGSAAVDSRTCFEELNPICTVTPITMHIAPSNLCEIDSPKPHHWLRGRDQLAINANTPHFLGFGPFRHSHHRVPREES